MLGLPCRHGSIALRPTLNHMAAMSAATFGVRAFFTPRMPPASFAADGTEGALSVYDTTPLKATLEELVDFDLINSRAGPPLGGCRGRMQGHLHLFRYEVYPVSTQTMSGPVALCHPASPR